MNLTIDLDDDLVAVTKWNDEYMADSFIETEATNEIKQKILEVVALVEAQDG